MPTYGAAPLFHLAGHTPEADRWATPAEELRITADDLAKATAAERERSAGVVDSGALEGAEDRLVCLGCPHATLAELEQVAELLAGHQVVHPLWLCTSRAIEAQATERGLTERLEASGALVVTDTCFVVAPLQGRFREIITNSAKGVYYARGRLGVVTRLLDTAACVLAALGEERA